MSSRESLRIAKLLKGLVWGFKVNDVLYEDMSIIRKLKKFGRVFVDVKLYDISNTVGNSVRRISRAGADIITVHASGGIEMMKAAKQNAGKTKIIAVTVLTSMKLKNMDEVIKLTRDAVKADVDGIVCSGQELYKVQKVKGTDSRVIIVPGIRPKSYKTQDDQVRTVMAAEAIKFGADYIVIGRPITQSKNILKALHDIVGE